MLRDASARRALALTSLLLAITLVGCDTSIDPLEDESGIFSVYGYLAVLEEPNYIRVKDLSAPLDGEATQELDAIVTLEELESGTVDTLTAVIDEFDGVHTHNFRVEDLVAPSTTYRLTVTRSDGATVQSTATTPVVTEVGYGPERENCVTRITIEFYNAEEPDLLQISVGFRYAGQMFWGQPQAQPGPDGSSVLSFTPLQIIHAVFPPDPYPPPGSDPEVLQCTDLDEDHLLVEYMHLGPEWRDRFVPIDPLESADIENGLGFFGGLHRDSFQMEIDTTLIPRLR